MTDKPSIQCAKNGPLLVKGLKNLTVLPGGAALDTGDMVALCRCGASQNKPYCDGGHAAKGFDDEPHPERTADKRDDYVGKEVTIHDNRSICAHAGFCTNALSAVFRLKQEPWIDADGASQQEVIDAVNACPSGALSYTIDGVEYKDYEAEPQVLVAPKGPYAVRGGVQLEGIELAQGASAEHFDLCRCGESKNKPFCDGSHWRSSFDG